MIKLYEIDYRLSKYNTVNTCLIDGKSKKDVVRKFWLLLPNCKINVVRKFWLSSPNCKIVITDIREITVI